ncbi:MAG TPA: cytochrome b/b6 domain-containing protein, partial [Burkholderiaceae bacterium]
MKSKRLRVWDAPVRLLHWALAVSVAAAWYTSGERGPAHEYLGYAAAVFALVRVVLGFTGGRYTRFAQFVRPPSATWRYLGTVLRSRAPRYLGHNPLGGWMVLA